MDRQYIDDHHIVARYLADQLSDSEREAFEAYYLEHPEFVKEMEAVARLKAGLSELQASGELDRLTATKPRSSGLRLLAAAAAVAAFAVGLFYFMDRGADRSPLIAASVGELDSKVAAIGIANTYQLMRMRGAERVDAEVMLPQPAGVIRLDILPEYDDPSTRYRAVVRTVETATPRELGTASGLVPKEDGFVTIYLNSQQVASGLYEIELEGESLPDTESSVFTIRIVDAGR